MEHLQRCLTCILFYVASKNCQDLVKQLWLIFNDFTLTYNSTVLLHKTSTFLNPVSTSPVLLAYYPAFSVLLSNKEIVPDIFS